MPLVVPLLASLLFLLLLALNARSDEFRTSVYSLNAGRLDARPLPNTYRTIVSGLCILTGHSRSPGLGRKKKDLKG